jgi:hypothetical protein
MPQKRQVRVEIKYIVGICQFRSQGELYTGP